MRIDRIIPILMIMTVSCSKGGGTVPVDGAPVTVYTTADRTTRGYIVSDVLDDTPGNRLYDTYDAPYRTLYVSAQRRRDGQTETFFVDQPFEYDGGLWRHSPAYLWPYGYELDMVSYSSGVPFTAGQVTYDRLDVTERMVLSIDSTHRQDDVVFGYVRQAESSDGSVRMVLRHSQAWLRFNVRCAEGLEGTIRLDGILLDDIYTDGELTVTRPYGYAEGEWSFRLSKAQLTAMDDNMSVFGSVLTQESIHADMLVPEQPMKAVVLRFTYLTTSDLQLEYELPVPLSTWRMGRMYVYNITFNPKEITVSPFVSDWTGAVQNVITSGIASDMDVFRMNFQY